jgi:hypothetical protein
VAGVFVDGEAKIGAVSASNITYGGDGGLNAELLDIVRQAEPRIPDEWEPAPLPDGVDLDLLGIWYWGPHAMALRALADGHLELHAPGGRGRESRFRRDGEEWVGLDGYWAGERLRIAADKRSLDLATFVFTREPYGEGPIPGSVDAAGWTAP